MHSGHSGEDSNPTSPSVIRPERKSEMGSSSIPEPPVKRKRGRPPLNPHVESSSMGKLFIAYNLIPCSSFLN